MSDNGKIVAEDCEDEVCKTGEGEKDDDKDVESVGERDDVNCEEGFKKLSAPSKSSKSGNEPGGKFGLKTV